MNKNSIEKALQGIADKRAPRSVTKGKACSGAKRSRCSDAETIILAFCRERNIDDPEKINALMGGFHLGIEAVVRHLIQNGCLTINGLGRFKWRHWSQRMGFNRYSGKPVVIPAANRLKFTPDDTLQADYTDEMPK